MAITKLSGVSWSSIVKVDGIAKASIAKVSGVTATPPAPIQYANLSLTKSGIYVQDTSNVYGESFSTAANAISSDYSYETPWFQITAGTVVGRFSINWVVSRANIGFDLSPYSAYTILDMKLSINVTNVITTAGDSTFLIMGLGGYTFSYPTLNNNDYSLYKQYGGDTIYGVGTVASIGSYEIGINNALGFANTHPSNFSMTLTTQYDRTDVAPPSNTFYTPSFDPPVLKITYQ